MVNIYYNGLRDFLFFQSAFFDSYFGFDIILMKMEFINN